MGQFTGSCSDLFNVIVPLNMHVRCVLTENVWKLDSEYQGRIMLHKMTVTYWLMIEDYDLQCFQN